MGNIILCKYPISRPSLPVCLLLSFTARPGGESLPTMADMALNTEVNVGIFPAVTQKQRHLTSLTAAQSSY